MDTLIRDLSVILVGAAALSFLAVLLKQPIILAYILCGAVAGPWGIGWIRHAEFIESISHLGITLLLFLAGLCLQPEKLFELFKKTSLVTFSNCAVSFLTAALLALLFRFSATDSLCIGLAMMFSSTILTIKLLPTTKLHQQRMGAICTGILVLQDLLAISVLAFIRCLSTPGDAVVNFVWLSVKLAGFIAILLVAEQFVLRKIMHRVDRFHEALFVLGLAWCFGISTVAHDMGLFYETGAFFAGVVLARQRVALFIHESLKPLRDFFLVLFFFSLGAGLNVAMMKDIILPAAIIAAVFLILKPWLFRKSFLLIGEKMDFSVEAGLRLGQLSEFSLLVALLALEVGHLSGRGSQLIQVTTILTFIVSSYLVVFRYPTPIGTTEQLIRD